MHNPSFLLVGPYDPHCGEYTFLAPPLGVWRLAGALREEGFHTEVFDPNIVSEPRRELSELVRSRPWNVIGHSTTGMTLRYDLSLAHEAAASGTNALLVAGGMEATFNPELVLELGPFDLAVLGEGEKPLAAMGTAFRRGERPRGIAGTAERGSTPGSVVRRHQLALNRDELKDAIFRTPYADMPYRTYWERLQDAYHIGSLPEKAAREARLSEIRAVRAATLNYCPMGCTFCSSTNFLNASQGSAAKVARLDAEECLEMVIEIMRTHPDTRTVIFQDDIFVFTSDDRIRPLCEGIIRAKADGQLPPGLEFISTNRIDAMTAERLTLMKRAGFRVLGFGVESFSKNVLVEFNKGRIYPFIEPALETAVALGLTPFLDIILASPRATMDDLATTLRSAYRWILAGCEVGIYPYVIPFSGAQMASNPDHEPVTVWERTSIPGTEISWNRPTKILPHDERLRETVLVLEQTFERVLGMVSDEAAHVPSRLRSLLWVLSGTLTLPERYGLPKVEDVVPLLLNRVSGPDGSGQRLAAQLDLAADPANTGRVAPAWS